MEVQTALKIAFPKLREWLMFWCKGYQEIRHIEYINKKFFYGNSSYMDLGELLRENSGMESSPCLIYDTDVHLSRTQNSGVLMKNHNFYICVLTDTQLDGEEIKRAKDKCELLALDFIGFFNKCKDNHNEGLKGCEVGNVDSTAPFLNGWEAVGLRIMQPIGVPCFDESKYDFATIDV